MADYSILIPAFNEGDVIGEVLKELGKPKFCKEVIVIDDGSSDDTAKVALKNGARVLSHQYNKGYGSALKTGINAAETDYVILFDGDGQHRLEDLLKIAEIVDQYDMIVGKREQASHVDWMRMPGKKVLGWFANLLTKKKIPDLNSGLRSFRVPVIKKYLHLMPDGFSFSTTSTIAMYRMGYTVHYLPIVMIARQGRKSTVKIFRDGIRVLMLILNLTVLFAPMRVFLPISAFFILLSMCYFILYSIFVRVHLNPMTLLLFNTGIILFFIGIVCEQISAIRRDSN